MHIHIQELLVHKLHSGRKGKNYIHKRIILYYNAIKIDNARKIHKQRSVKSNTDTAMYIHILRWHLGWDGMEWVAMGKMEIKIDIACTELHTIVSFAHKTTTMNE